MKNPSFRLVCSFSVGLALAACAAAQTGSPRAGSDALGIVTPDTNSIAVRVRAALTPPSPAPRTCAYNALYTLNLKTHELSWDFCFAAEKDKRTLQPGEVAALDAALARLRVVPGSGLCPVDAPTISVTTSGDVTREYHADLCGGPPPVLDIDATEGLIKVLYKLTGN